MADIKATDSISVESQRYLEFKIGAESFAIPLLQVREVIRVPKTTPVPNSPDYFLGIMNLRGHVISIVDVAKKVNINPNDGESEPAVIILDLESVTIGITVDAVLRVLAIHGDALSSPPTMNEDQDYVTGIYKNNDSMTLIIDIAKILDVNEFVSAEEEAA